MELKFLRNSFLLYRLMLRSNRTFMELKLLDAGENIGFSVGSNRTFMELKYSKGENTGLCLSVLIAPLWN